MSTRRSSDTGRLIRLGFSDLDRARRLCAVPRLEPLLAGEDVDGEVLVDIGLSADPDQALLLLVRILEACDDREWRRLVAALQADGDLRRRLVDVIGMSEALGDFIARHHSEWEVLADAEALAVAPSAPRGSAGRRPGRAPRRRRRVPLRRHRDGQVRRPRAQLRQRRRRHLRRRAGRRAWTRRARWPPRRGWRQASCAPAPQRPRGNDLGGRRQPAAGGQGRRAGAHLAVHVGLLRALGEDVGVPGAAQGPPVAGDLELGEEYVDAVSPLVWRPPTARLRRGRAGDAPAGRAASPARTPTASSSSARAGCATSSSPCSCCSSCTAAATSCCAAPHPVALEALAPGATSGARTPRPGRAYRFLRTLEHRIQLHRLRRTTRVPRRRGRPAPARPLARASGRTRSASSPRPGGGTARGAPPAREAVLPAAAQRRRPLDAGRGAADAGGGRAAARGARLRRPGRRAAPPRGADRGVSRRAAIQRTLLPVMLGWFADAPDPDAGLLGFRQVSDALGSTHWYLRLLRDESPAAERLARVLASSRYAADLLLRHPRPCHAGRRRRAAAAPAATLMVTEALAAGRAARRARRRRRAGRAICGAASSSGSPSPSCSGGRGRRQAGVALSTSRRRRSRGGLEIGTRGRVEPGAAADALRRDGMGRFGGGELGFAATPTSCSSTTRCRWRTSAATRRPRRRRRAAPTAHAPPGRPAARHRRGPAAGGPQGPLVRTLGSYARTTSGGRRTWEAQALLRVPTRWPATRAGGAVPRARRPLRYPDRRLSTTTRTRDPPAQGADGVRAAAPRCRPEPAHQARPRWAERRRVGRAAAPAPAWSGSSTAERVGRTGRTGVDRSPECGAPAPAGTLPP
jgi:hypothetical protein